MHSPGSWSVCRDCAAAVVDWRLASAAAVAAVGLACWQHGQQQLLLSFEPAFKRIEYLLE